MRVGSGQLLVSRGGVVRLALGLILGMSGSVEAFTLETTVTRGCHEQISRAALERAPALLARVQAGPRLASRFVAELPFTFPEDWDAWTAGLLIGVRYNDLHGAGP